MTKISEEQLAELIAALPPAPPSWVDAASALPAAREAIDEIVARASEAHAARAAVLADLEAALREAGIEPRPQHVDHLRERLRS